MHPRLAVKMSAVLLAALVVTGLTGCSTTSPKEPCKVTSKDHSYTSKGTSVYRIYSSCGVFNVEDAPLVGQFNSADTYGQILPGHTYRFTTYGFRNGFFSMFPNITKAVEVK